MESLGLEAWEVASAGGGTALVGGIWVLAALAARALREHPHRWDEYRIGAALLRRICRECGELRLGREPYHGISLANREGARLFEFRPELISTYTKPRILQILEAGTTSAFGQRKAG